MHGRHIVWNIKIHQKWALEGEKRLNCCLSSGQEQAFVNHLGLPRLLGHETGKTMSRLSKVEKWDITYTPKKRFFWEERRGITWRFGISLKDFKENDSLYYVTNKDGSEVFAVATAWPESELSFAKVDPVEGSEIFMLGYDQPLEWTVGDDGYTRIQIPDKLQDPENRPCDHAWTFRIKPVENYLAASKP